MSKKTPEYKRLFKLYKAGFFDKVAMTEAQELLLRKHYPFLIGKDPEPENISNCEKVISI